MCGWMTLMKNEEDENDVDSNDHLYYNDGGGSVVFLHF